MGTTQYLWMQSLNWMQFHRHTHYMYIYPLGGCFSLSLLQIQSETTITNITSTCIIRDENGVYLPLLFGNGVIAPLQSGRLKCQIITNSVNTSENFGAGRVASYCALASPGPLYSAASWRQFYLHDDTMLLRTTLVGVVKTP